MEDKRPKSNATPSGDIPATIYFAESIDDSGDRNACAK